jgi:AAA domain
VIARALRTGQKFLGNWNVPEPTNVIYLCPEIGARTFKKRCVALGIHGPRFRVQTIADGSPLDLDDPVLLTAVRELSPVIFLDTAIRFSSSKDENSAAENQALARAIFAVIHAGAKAVVCLHHRSKEGAKAEELTLENTLRGSGDIGAICDAVWGLQYDRGDGSPAYIKESRQLVRLEAACVKARDFRPPDGFRIQLFPHLYDIGDFAVLAEVEQRSDGDRLAAAIAEDPARQKIALEKLTGIGRNRQDKLAAESGWTFDRKTGWSRT